MVEKKLFSKGFRAQHLTIVLFYFCLLAGMLYFPGFIETIFHSKESKELFISGFSDVITEEVFRLFEEETDIKVYPKYCDSDFEMLAQLSMGDESGYDLVSPSSYMAELMIKEDLLEPVDVSTLENFNDIDSFFLRNYTEGMPLKMVPISWSVHGLGFKKSFFDHRGIKLPNSLAYVLQPEKIFTAKALRGRFKNYRVCIADDSQELVCISSIFLFGDVSDFSRARLQKIYDLLIKQRKWSLAYTTADVTYYLSHCAPVVLALGAHVKNTLDENPSYDFTLTKEGSLLTVVNLCIPKKAKNRDSARKFIDFILSPKIQAMLFDQTGFCPTNVKGKELMPLRYAKHKAYSPDRKTMEKFYDISTLLSIKDSQELINSVKAS